MGSSQTVTLERSTPLGTPQHRSKLILTGAILLMAALTALVSTGQAHRSGCHRWHSCPSDSGSYVCGDLGYTTFCPNTEAAIPTPTPKVKTQPLRPAKVTRGVPYIHSYDLRAMGMDIAQERSNWFQLGIKKLDMRLQVGSKTALLGSRRTRVALKALPVIWQGALYIPASAIKTMGCKVDTKYLPSGVLLDCSGVKSKDVVFVKIW